MLLVKENMMIIQGTLITNHTYINQASDMSLLKQSCYLLLNKVSNVTHRNRKNTLNASKTGEHTQGAQATIREITSIILALLSSAESAKKSC
jgi:hypothetical protein